MANTYCHNGYCESKQEESSNVESGNKALICIFGMIMVVVASILWYGFSVGIYIDPMSLT